MPVPTIDPESSVLSYPQWVQWGHAFSATNSPTGWNIASGSFPSGMTFQPSFSATGENSDDLIDAAGHGLVDGTVLVFAAKSGGSSLSTATRYFIVNATTDTFQLAATPGGAALNFGSDITAATLIRPGFLIGTATVPGISTVRLVATNGDGDSAPVLFTIGIEPAAAAADSNDDLIWDLVTGIVSSQSGSVVQNVGTVPAGPVLSVKETDDRIIRVRFVKSGTFIALNTVHADGNLQLFVKEFEPESQLVVSDEFQQQGEGAGTCYLLHAKFDGNALAGSLTNYEDDGGTVYDGLADLRIVYVNPESIGGETLVLNSRTFKIRIERSLGGVVV